MATFCPWCLSICGRFWEFAASRNFATSPIGGGRCRSIILGTRSEWRGSTLVSAQLPGLKLVGSAFRGVGVPDCIRSGQAATEEVLL